MKKRVEQEEGKKRGNERVGGGGMKMGDECEKWRRKGKRGRERGREKNGRGSRG